MELQAAASPHPRVFVSYSHDSEHHVDRAVALADKLRAGGVDCQIDEYEESPPEGWEKWMIAQIQQADYVVIVCTEVYARRFEGREEQGKGLGATWEGAIITHTLYQQSLRNTRFVPVLFSSEDIQHIPSILQPVTRYDLSTDDGYELLYRRLTRQPRRLKPELGPIQAMPPKARKHDFQKPLAASSESAVGFIRRIVTKRMDGLLAGKMPLVGKADLIETAVLSGINGDDALRAVGNLVDSGLFKPFSMNGSDDLIVNLDILKSEETALPDSTTPINWAKRMKDAAATRPTLEELKAPVASIESLKRVVSVLAHNTVPYEQVIGQQSQFPFESALALRLVIRQQDDVVALTFEGLTMLEQIVRMEPLTTLVSQMIQHPAVRNLLRVLQPGRVLTKMEVLELPVVTSTKCLWQWMDFLAKETGVLKLHGETISWASDGTNW